MKIIKKYGSIPLGDLKVRGKRSLLNLLDDDCDIDIDNIVRVIHIGEGLKVFMPNKDSCLQLEKKIK